MGFKSLFSLALLFSISSFADWQPTGATRPGLSPQCHPQLWSWRFLQTSDEIKRAQSLSSLAHDCSAQWQLDQPQGVEAQKRLMDLKTEPRKFESFFFLDRNQIQRQGFWLMQDTAERRPAVVVACDLDCSLRSPWVQRVIQHLAEEGPFHLIFVSPPTLRVDERWLTGGFDEGQALYEVGFWLQTQAPIRQKISSLQLLGEGWGAQGVLMALLYNQKNPIASDRQVFQGHLALCPAVNLKSALETLDHPTTPDQIRLSDQIRLHLLSRKQQSPLWQKWLSGWNWAEPLSDFWVQASLQQKRDDHLLQPFRSRPPRNGEDWLWDNDLSLQVQSIQLPSWVLASSNDPLFDWDSHSALLASQNQDPAKSKLRVIALADSTSCAWGASMGWDVEGALWRSLLLSQSFEIWPRQSWPSIPWSEITTPLESGEMHLEQAWMVNLQGQVRLDFWIQSARGLKKIERQVDTSSWPKPIQPEVKNEAEASRWTRILNARLRLVDEAGRPLIQSAKAAKRLQWWNWSSQ